MPEALASALLALPDRYNISGRTPAAVVFKDASQKKAALQVGEFTWGLVPKWSKEPQTKYTTVTARLQRAPRSRIFRGPWEGQRCVIPMNGYYKWDRTSKPAMPYFIQAQDGKTLFAAGLWELWEKGDAPLATCTVLTHPNRAIPPPLVADGPVFLPCGTEPVGHRPAVVSDALPDDFEAACIGSLPGVARDPRPRAGRLHAARTHAAGTGHGRAHR